MGFPMQHPSVFGGDGQGVFAAETPPADRSFGIACGRALGGPRVDRLANGVESRSRRDHVAVEQAVANEVVVGRAVSGSNPLHPAHLSFAESNGETISGPIS